MATYDLVRNFPLEIESYELEGLKVEASPEFVRRTTVIHLHGGGHEGVGEDVTYSSEDQEALQAEGPTLPLAGSHTLDSFSQLLDRMALFPSGPGMDAFLDYRRWAYESAALDLALRQAGTSLAAAVEREPQPVTFVVSLRIENPPALDPIPLLLERYPKLRFKLDPTGEWDAKLVKALAETGAVDTVDLKGAYKGTPVDQAGDPLLYGLVAQAFPDAWIEDPDLNGETDVILEPHRDRVTWDAPIHSVLDIKGSPSSRGHSTSSRLASAASSASSRATTTARTTRSRSTAAASGSSAQGAGTSSTSPRSSTRRRRTTLLRRPSTSTATTRPPGLPTSPLQPQPSKTGFRWGEG